MNELAELYQETILDHNVHPRHYGLLKNASHKAVGDNPLCGDHLEVALVVKNNKIVDIGFEGRGCVISRSSASIMTDIVLNKTVAQAKKDLKLFKDIVTGPFGESVDTKKAGTMALFAGVRQFPSRVKCASLPWHTLNAALHNKKDVVTKEHIW